ncbi:DNA-binding transcriptional LysR family regulator [Sporosarcina luteola]|nr:DNA-binding transcriptional LysR family regulator [Sporosarcina luteola]
MTEAGRKFQLYANKMIKLNEEARMAIGGKNELSGTLIIGAQESQCTYRLPPILLEFRRQYPDVKVVFKPAHSDGIARRELQEGLLDIAFIMDTSKPGDALQIECLIQEKIKLIVSPDHHLLAKSEVHFTDLEEETFLLTESGCSYRTLLENSLRAAEVYPSNKFEFGSIEAIKQCVIAGLGIAVLPEMAVEADIKAGKLKELAWADTLSPIFTQIAWHKDKRMTPPLQAFIEITQESFKARKGRNEIQF